MIVSQIAFALFIVIVITLIARWLIHSDYYTLSDFYKDQKLQDTQNRINYLEQSNEQMWDDYFDLEMGKIKESDLK